MLHIEKAIGVPQLPGLSRPKIVNFLEKERKSENFLPLALPSLGIAGGFSALIYFLLEGDQKYSSFTVGALAWGQGTKTNDFVAIFLFILLTPVVALLLDHLDGSITKSDPELSGRGLRSHLNSFLPILALWFGIIISSSAIGLLLPALYIYAVLLTVTVFWFQFLRLQRVGSSAHATLTNSDLLRFLGAPFMGWFSIIGMYLFLERFFSASLEFKFFELLANGIFLVLLVALLWLSGTRVGARLASVIRTIFASSTVGLPLLLSGLLPAKIVAGGESFAPVKPQWALLLFVCVLIIIGLVGWILNFTTRQQVQGSRRFKFLRFMPFLAVIIFSKIQPSGLVTLSVDDYHFGEFTVPWLALIQGGKLPYEGLEPARGIVNYLGSATSSLFFDGSVAGASLTSIIIYAVLAMTFVVVVINWLPSWVIALALVLFPAVNGISEIDLAVTIFVVAMLGLSRASSHLVSGLVAGLLTGAIIIFAPGQGAIAAASIGIAYFASTLKDKNKTIAKLLGYFLGNLFLLGIPLIGQMYLGALRYGLEQISMNSVANGIEWQWTFGAVGNNALWMEVMRASWLLVPILFISVLFLSWRKLSENPTSKTLALGLTLLTLLFVVRAAGRIDPGFSRMGIAGIWFLALLVPIYFTVVSPYKLKIAHLLTWLTVTGLLVPSLSPGLLTDSPLARIRGIVSSTQVDQSTLIDAQLVAEEFPAIGLMNVDRQKLASLQGLRSTLDSLLPNKNDPYLDLTNRAANYYYVGRVPAIAVPAVYNLVSEGQQSRAIAELEIAHPAVILVANENIYHDGGPIGLRSPKLYAWVLRQLKTHTLMTEEGRVWLVERRLASEAGGLAKLKVLPDTLAADSLRAIWGVSDLRGIAASFGRSWDTLEDKSNPVTKGVEVLETHDLSRSGEFYSVTGEDPYLRFRLNGKPRKVDDLDLLRFQFECKGQARKVGKFSVYWAKGENEESDVNKLLFDARVGENIVPLYASIDWQLDTRTLQSIRIDMEPGSVCEDFQISNMELRSVRNK